MTILDPLTHKIKQLLAAGILHPLDAARTQYGSREDYRVLGLQLTSALSSESGVIVIDLSPFNRIGNIRAFREFVLSIADPEKVLFFVGPRDLLELLVEYRERHAEVSYVEIDERARLVAGVGPALLCGECEWLIEAVSENVSFAEARKTLIGARLSGWVRDTLITADSTLVPDEDRVALDGRRYIRMQTGMVVSSYVNMKAILSSPDRLVDLAVEICWQIFDGFRRDDVTAFPGWIVVPNNTALQLGASVQAISQLPLAVVDHIGPVPSPGVAQRVSAGLKGSEVVLLTDVSATGGEIDRSILFLTGQGALVTKVICPVWLDVGRCQLMRQIPFVALCRPKKSIGYEYRSE